MNTFLRKMRLTGLWHNQDFLRMWSAHTISQFGSQITILAVPLTAALTLHATPVQMGLLTAMNTLPNLLFALPLGALVDRWPKRPLLISMDVIRFVLLLIIPAMAIIGQLNLATLYGVTFLSGIATLVFDLAAQAYLPVLVQREYLVDGNAKLETSHSAATVAGPASAGILMQVLGAPLAVLFDALTYLISALFMAGVRQKEVIIPRVQQGLWSDIAEGIQIMRSNPILRTIFRTATLWNFSVNTVQAVLILFATRDLRLSTGQLGLLFSMLGVGMSAGAILAQPVRTRFGIGMALIGSGFFAASSGLLALLSGLLGRETGFPVLVISQFIFGMGPTIFGITALSLRQAVTPIHLQGRVNATYRFGVWGTLPLGALLGGFIGERFGLLSAIGVGAGGMVIAVALLLLSPLPTLRDLSTEEEDGLSVAAGSSTRSKQIKFNS